MADVAAKALKLYDEEAPAKGPPSKGEGAERDYSADLATEMEAFADALAAKDFDGMAAAFKEAKRLCK